ncbi:MAG: hypothetical protein HOE76_04035 [Euryarchaeota archaeon]|jgi:hypothetical protein|nr:hypothetical protein [Euryarchaeota archaeon]MBT4981977.1 hypothetical protein [Euryarchaeota archaeon]MBT5184250.1 hypothetical protein [Euryarchaeota archaeon]
MKNRRENFLISGIVLIILGALFSLAVNIAMGGVLGLSGIICFFIGMSTPTELELSPEAVAAWEPSMERLPDAGRFMYRVDVTMDEPIKTTILCGPCGNLETVDGPRPEQYTCSSCDRNLWSLEEE